MTGPLKAPCQHGRYDEHRYETDGYGFMMCPGGTLLAEDTLVIVKEWTGFAEPQWPEWAVSLLGLYGPDGAPVNVREILDALAAAQPGQP